MKKQTGFTIVELAIVIAVIGILAAITVVAFNGIQERARLASGRAFASQLERKHLATAEGVWEFDECSGTPQNRKTNSVSGTVVGTVNWSTDTPSGKGCAMRFDGNTRITTNASLGAKYYLKAAWVKFNACGNNNVISSPDVGGNDAPLYLPNCRIYAGHNGNYGRISSTEVLEPNKWYHIAVEFIDGTYSLYLDGKKIRESTGHPDLTPTDSGVNIGAHRTGSRFAGTMDDVMIVAKQFK